MKTRGFCLISVIAVGLSPIARGLAANAQDVIARVGPLTPNEADAPAMSTAVNQRFDVVSIRPCPNPSNTPGFVGRGSVIGPGGTIAGWNSMRPQLVPGHVLWTCEPLQQLVYEAYAGKEHPLINTVILPRPGLPAPVKGGPSWAYTDSFTIEAKGDAIADATLASMLRGVLEDRFQLKVRRVTEQQDVYGMTVATGGINTKVLQTPTPGDCITSDQRRAAMTANPPPDPRTVLPACGSSGLHVDREVREHVWTSVTLQEIAADLTSFNVGRYVIDQTGIDANFNCTIKIPADESGFPPSDPGWVFHELERMGLKLTPTKAPAEHLQIDHAEKPRLQ